MPFFVIFCKRAWVIPVSEPKPITQGIAPYHGDECVQNQTDTKQHLAYSQPELGFTIPLDGKDVEEAINGTLELSCANRRSIMGSNADFSRRLTRRAPE